MTWSRYWKHIFFLPKRLHSTKSYFIKAIDHTRPHHTRKACKSLAFGSWFTSFSRVLPTSRVGYHAGKPMESMVYCLNISIKTKRQFFLSQNRKESWNNNVKVAGFILSVNLISIKRESYISLNRLPDVYSFQQVKKTTPLFRSFNEH